MSGNNLLHQLEQQGDSNFHISCAKNCLTAKARKSKGRNEEIGQHGSLEEASQVVLELQARTTQRRSEAG